MRDIDAADDLKGLRITIIDFVKACAILAACLVLSCVSSPPALQAPCGAGAAHPALDVRVPECEGARQGLLRGIVGAPEEMLDTAVLNAGTFGAAEARVLREVLRSEARAAGFCGESGQQAVTLRVRVLTHLARVGELWPRAEYLVKAEYTVAGKDAAAVPVGTVNMYYSAWFYWSMDSLRRDVMRSLAGKIVCEIGSDLGDGTGEAKGIDGRAKFFDSQNAAREAFLGE